MVVVMAAWVLAGLASAEAALTKEDIQEIRQVIREELKPMEARIDGLEKRLDSLERSVEARFSWILTMLSAVIALNGVMVGAVIWLARQDKPITQRHYEQILTREDRLEEELRSLKKDFETLKPHKA